ncbi:MAG: gas vesicle protein GvpN [Oscillatoriales cyanobacterium SM2_2_1]|nr:gas vesicle protein GvpN [Oscillatoriales cyanobacterium SM2_2_1]
MTTILQASPRQFVSTEFTKQIVRRALRYLQSGFAVHLRGAAGTGKTTLAMHLAGLLTRPMVLIYGDEDLNSSQLVGSLAGYTRKKVIDNYIHSVLKVEDDLKHSWMDSRLTLAAKEGFTLIYDEFNRSRPEVNNVLLSVLEEKLIVLPPDSSQSEYVRVHPQFRAIFTSNPEEYAGVHPTQDALLDRMITIDVGEPDLDTERQILMERVGLERVDALKIISLVRSFRHAIAPEDNHGSASLRVCLMIGRICREHEIPVSGSDGNFRDLCFDVLLSRVRETERSPTVVLAHLLDQL